MADCRLSGDGYALSVAESVQKIYFQFIFVVEKRYSAGITGH